MIVLVALLGSSPSAHADTAHWANTYGGTGDDVAWAVEQTSDLGYILAGQTYSFGSGSTDVWILKLAASGSVEWQRAYGGAEDDVALSVHQTPDGGYIVAGYTGPVTNYDMWVLKLDSNGNIVWEYAYGAANQEFAEWVERTSDGGYILGGRTLSILASAPDFWALKLDSNGAVLWDRTYSLAQDRRIEAIHQTSDNGYILAGSTSSGFGPSVAWVIKTDADGNIVWQRTYDPGFGADVEDIRVTSDGGYVLIAEASQTLGGPQDFWVLKLQSDGAVEWERTYGGTGSEDAQVIRQTSDGGYILGGATSSFGAGGNDVWIVKLNQNGEIVWERTYGGAGDEEADGIDQTADGGYVVAGQTTSFGAGGKDVWLLRIDSTGNINGCAPEGTSSAIVTVTHATVVNTDGIASSIDEVRTETDATITPTSVTPSIQCFAPAATAAPVGGFMESANKLVVFAPYVALFGLIAVVAVAAAPWKKREN